MATALSQSCSETAFTVEFGALSAGQFYRVRIDGDLTDTAVNIYRNTATVSVDGATPVVLTSRIRRTEGGGQAVGAQAPTIEIV